MWINFIVNVNINKRGRKNLHLVREQKHKKLILTFLCYCIYGRTRNWSKDFQRCTLSGAVSTRVTVSRVLFTLQRYNTV